MGFLKKNKLRRVATTRTTKRGKEKTHVWVKPGVGEESVAIKPQKPAASASTKKKTSTHSPHKPLVSLDASVGRRTSVTGKSEIRRGAKLSGKTTVDGSTVGRDTTVRDSKILAGSYVGKDVKVKKSLLIDTIVEHSETGGWETVQNPATGWAEKKMRVEIEDSQLKNCFVSDGKVKGSNLVGVGVYGASTVVNSRMKHAIVREQGYVENVDGEGFVVEGTAVVRNVTLPEGTKIGGDGTVEYPEDFIVIRNPAGGKGTVTVHRTRSGRGIDVQEMDMESRWEGLPEAVAAATSKLTPHPLLR